MKVYYIDRYEICPAIIKFVNVRRNTVTIIKFVNGVPVEREVRLCNLFTKEGWPK